MRTTLRNLLSNKLLYKFVFPATQFIRFKHDVFGIRSRFLKRCFRLQETIWLTLIDDIFKFSPHLDSFCQPHFFVNSLEATRSTQFKYNIFGPVPALLERNLANYKMTDS